MGFGQRVDDMLAQHSFPTTSEALRATHGDEEIRLPGGMETVGDVLGRLPDSEFECEEDARLMIYSAFGTAAIGRQRYSDRDPPCVGEDVEQVSL